MNLDDIKNMTKEDLLGKFGLVSKPTFSESFFPALGIFGAGMLLGAGIALMLAPKSGSELREDMVEGLKSLGNQVTGGNPATTTTPGHQMSSTASSGSATSRSSLPGHSAV